MEATRNEALTTYFEGTGITFKQLETIAMSLEDNAKIIVPQGNAMPIILTELEHTHQMIPLPVASQTMASKTTEGDKSLKTK